MSTECERSTTGLAGLRVASFPTAQRFAFTFAVATSLRAARLVIVTMAMAQASREEVDVGEGEDMRSVGPDPVQRLEARSGVGVCRPPGPAHARLGPRRSSA